jgi:glutathione S-transferase
MKESNVILIVIGTVLAGLFVIAISFRYVIKIGLSKYMQSKWSEEPGHDVANSDDVRKPGILYVHAPALRPWGFPNASPFTLKLETWLQLHKIKYTVIRGFDTANAPKGKVPWIELDGQKMGDSELIIQFLKKNFNIDDDPLTDQELAVSHAFKTMACEHMTACMGYARNVEYVEDTLKAYTGLKRLALPLKLVAKMIKSQTFKRLSMHGLTRHSREEIYEFGIRDMQAISNYLGKKPFFHGDVITEVDANLFAMLCSIAWIPLPDWPMKSAFFSDPSLSNLQPYLLRVKNHTWGDTSTPWYTGDELNISA